MMPERVLISSLYTVPAFKIPSRLSWCCKTVSSGTILFSGLSALFSMYLLVLHSSCIPLFCEVAWAVAGMEGPTGLVKVSCRLISAWPPQGYNWHGDVRKMGYLRPPGNQRTPHSIDKFNVELSFFLLLFLSCLFSCLLSFPTLFFLLSCLEGSVHTVFTP